MRITKSDFESWWASPVGIEVKKMLLERQNKIAHTAGAGTFLGLEIEGAKASGRYMEIQDLLEMTFEELMGE